LQHPECKKKKCLAYRWHTGTFGAAAKYALPFLTSVPITPVDCLFRKKRFRIDKVEEICKVGVCADN
jgi:hypothetical protein